MNRSKTMLTLVSTLMLLVVATACSSSTSTPHRPDSPTGLAAPPQLAERSSTPSASTTCRRATFNREDRTPPDPTIRTCACKNAETIRTSVEIKGVGRYYLSTRNWDDGYLCSHGLHLVYGNVAVDFEHTTLTDPAKAVRYTQAMAKTWGGKATEIKGHPAYVVAPNLPSGSVGEVLILVDGDMIRMVGNSDASEDDIVALANTFDI